MARDYTPNDGGYVGPMTIANIFADGIRETIEDRKQAEKQNLAVMANQQDNDLRRDELAQRKELQEAELNQRRELHGEEMGLRRDELKNRMSNNSAELEIQRQRLAAERLRIEASTLGTKAQRAKAEAIMGNTRMAAGLLGVELEGDAAKEFGAAFSDSDVTDPNSAALKALDDSVAAGISGARMPGEPPLAVPGVAQPVANEPSLPESPDAPLEPGSLLDPAPDVGARGETGARGPEAPAPSLPSPPAAEEDAEYRLKLKKLLAMKKLAKDPNTPVNYQIQLEEQAMRLESDPDFAMQVKNHAAKIKLAEERQALPTVIFASPVEKQRAFNATYPHLKFAITEPGEEAPQLLRIDGTPIPDAEFRIIKSAWDQFEFKPGMVVKPVSGPTPFGVPVPKQAPATPPAVSPPPRPGIGILPKVDNAPAQRFWTEGKEQASRLAKLADATDEELQALATGDGLRSDLGFAASRPFSEALAKKIAPLFKMPPGADKPEIKGRSGEVTPEDFIRAAAADELRRRTAAPGPALTPDKAAQVDAIFQ